MEMGCVQNIVKGRGEEKRSRLVLDMSGVENDMSIYVCDYGRA